jgi:hypothetical protein
MSICLSLDGGFSWLPRSWNFTIYSNALAIRLTSPQLGPVTGGTIITMSLSQVDVSLIRQNLNLLVVLWQISRSSGSSTPRVFYVRQPGTILQVRARVLFARHIRFAALLTVFSQSGATATVTTVSPVYSGTMSATNTASSILDLSLNGVQFIFRDILAGVGSSANYQFMFYDQPVVHSVNPKSSPQAGKGIASVLAFNVWRDSKKLKCKFAGPDGNVRMS